jgi:phosphoglycerate kinase
MAKLTVDDLQLKGKTVLMRVDFNVPLDEAGNITDDLRIKAALPTIQKIIGDGGKAVLCSHMGRPKGERKPEFSLKPAAEHLSALLGEPVKFADDCIGKGVDALKKNLRNGEVLLLENLRFHKGETDNDPAFAQQLASGCDLYINDAFGSAHRAHASTEGATKYFSLCAAGYLLQKELQYLGDAVGNPQRPFVAIIGGAKISGKIDVIENLMTKTDQLLIGGGMTYTFMKSRGQEIGNSLVEDDKLDVARKLLAGAGEKLVLPQDFIVTDRLDFGGRTVGPTKVVPQDGIPKGWEAVDIGPASVAQFRRILNQAKTIVWNGPVGVFEIAATAKGTFAVAEALAEATANGATTIIGGGDSAAAIKSAGLDDKVSHVSTGGGASLEFLEGKALPGVAALTEA